ncbi:aminoglycoside phosphotransferase family protein [Auraticoccus cholistanensis]|uniref:aminoglycoside phosphotransferase family protein n=1 Tax=Auraticoccus cholistanensis TaxID=2656650 RepID=UPI0018D2629F
MPAPDVRLQPLARGRVASLGEAGQRWLDGLPLLLEELQRRWDVRLEGRGLPGGSASWVGRAVARDGSPRVVKVAVPGHDLAGEALVLSLAEGRGLVRLHGHDPEADAVLLEALGRPLGSTRLPPEEKLDHLVAALREVWRLPADRFPVPGPGEDKASGLTRLVLDTDARLGHPCPPEVLHRALDHAARRAADHRPDRCVVVHGDPHAGNALASDDGGLPYRLIDPDGFLADPAYDLGVVLRDWTDLGGRPRERLEGACARLAEAAGLPAQAVWEWAFLERVSTALHLLDLGAETLGRRLLDSASALL